MSNETPPTENNWLDFNNAVDTSDREDKCCSTEIDQKFDTKMVSRYLDVVFGYLNGGFIPLRSFPEKTAASRIQSHNIWIQNGDERAKAGQTFVGWCNKNQMACYCIPGLVSKQGEAKAEHIIEMGVLLIDLDYGDVKAKLLHAEQFLGKPTLVIESGGITDEGHNKLHAYWRLSEPARSEDLITLLKLRYELALKIGSDRCFKSAHQPIRIAGSIHHKHTPRLVSIRSETDEEVHLTELVDLIDIMPAIQDVKNAPSTQAAFLDFNTAANHVVTVGDVLTKPVRKGSTDDWSRFEGASSAIGHYIRMAHEGRMTRDDAWDAVCDYNQAMLRPPWPVERLISESDRLWNKHCEKYGGAATDIQDQDDWPEPDALSNIEGESVPYPLEYLPKVLCDAAREVSRFVKVPLASPAVIGLSVAALAIGKKARIQERPGLYHHPALFHTLIAASGERKSPSFKLMTRPLEKWIEGSMDKYQQNAAEVSTNNQVLDALLGVLKKQASNPKLSDGERHEFMDKMAQEECKRTKVPPHPRMFTSDATEERLFQRMHIRNGEYAVLSGEGRPVFDSIMGKHSGKQRTGDAIYLAGISGDTITRDRVGNEKGPEDRMIVNPCLNVCIMVQPDKYLEAARHPTLRESGALARIWPVWLPCLVGTRLEEADEPGLNPLILEPFEEIILSLLNSETPDEDQEEFCHLLTLSPQAQEARRKWHNIVEMQMADGRSLDDVRDIASKVVSATAKAALVLHLIDHPQQLAYKESVLNLDTWVCAQKLGEYHLAEAVRVQRYADGDTNENTVAKIVRWAIEHDITIFSIRTLSRSGPRPRLGKKEAEKVMEDMIEMGWARMLPPSKDVRTTRYQINPKCHSVSMSSSADGLSPNKSSRFSEVSPCVAGLSPK